MNSFAYFAQPTYWRADYGYRGDWAVEDIVLVMPKAGNEGVPAEEVAAQGAAAAQRGGRDAVHAEGDQADPCRPTARCRRR